MHPLGICCIMDANTRGNIMKNLWNSGFMQKLGMVTNLVVLNILWLLCCIPVVTAGAATTALYYTVFQYLTNQDDAIFRPFFRAIRQNFKQATLLWLPMLAFLALLVFDGMYIAANGGGILLTVVIVTAVILMLLLTHIFPMVARFQMTAAALLRTAFSLIMLHLPSTLLMFVLNIAPVMLMLFAPAGFFKWLPLWAGLWFALAALLNGKMLLKIWSKHLPKQSSDEEST